jgi:hypothetical protein
MYKNIPDSIPNKNHVVVFICHNNESIASVFSKLEYEHIFIILVGDNNVKTEYLLHPKIIIARQYLDNIEHEKKLLTFTAWYLIIKNNLFKNVDYLCLLEYDTDFMGNFLERMDEECKSMKHDVICFDECLKNFLKDVDTDTLYRFVCTRGITYYEYGAWNHTTNQCVRRDILNHFVDWYYPGCLDIKKTDYVRLSWYHERCFSIFLSTQHKKYYVIRGILMHFSNKSHEYKLNIPVADFDWKVYAQLNPDVRNFNGETNEEFITHHFIQFGFGAGRKYRLT